VFAATDVRSGSVKRCASVVGEGAMAVRFVHAPVEAACLKGCFYVSELALDAVLNRRFSMPTGPRSFPAPWSSKRVAAAAANEDGFSDEAGSAPNPPPALRSGAMNSTRFNAARSSAFP